MFYNGYKHSASFSFHLEYLEEESSENIEHTGKTLIKFQTDRQTNRQRNKMLNIVVIKHRKNSAIPCIITHHLPGKGVSLTCYWQIM